MNGYQLLAQLAGLQAAGALDTVGDDLTWDDLAAAGALDTVGAPFVLPKIAASPAKRLALAAAAARLGGASALGGVPNTGNALSSLALASALGNAGINASGMPALAGMDGVATSRTGVTSMPSTYADMQRACSSSTDFDVTAGTNVLAAGASGTATVIAPVAFKPILLSMDPTVAANFRLTRITIGRVTYNLSAGSGQAGLPCTIYSAANALGGKRVMYDPLDAGQTMSFDVTNTSAGNATFEMIVGALAVGKGERMAQSLGVGFG